MSSRPGEQRLQRVEDLFDRGQRRRGSEDALVAPGHVHAAHQVALGVLDDLVASGRVVEGVEFDPRERRSQPLQVVDEAMVVGGQRAAAGGRSRVPIRGDGSRRSPGRRVTSAGPPAVPSSSSSSWPKSP